MESINRETLKDLLEKKDELVVVDFYANWCGPCKMIGPVIEKLATEYEGKATITKVDIESDRELAQEYKVRSIPTILFFKNGEVIDKSIGNVSKTQLESMIENHS